MEPERFRVLDLPPVAAVLASRIAKAQSTLPSGPKATKTAGEVGDATIGRTGDVQYTTPTKPAIPESLKDSTFNTNVRVRVVFGADGQSRATVVKHAGSGLSALDDVALAACSHIRFKPAYQDGSPVDGTHEFNFEFKQ